MAERQTVGKPMDIDAVGARVTETVLLGISRSSTMACGNGARVPISRIGLRGAGAAASPGVRNTCASV